MITSYLNRCYDTLKPCIKYNPLNNYHWNTLTQETGRLKIFLDTMIPFTVVLPSNIGRRVHRILSIIEIISTIYKRGRYLPIFIRACEVVGNYYDPKIGLMIDLVWHFKAGHRLESAAYSISDSLNLVSCLKLSKRNALIISVVNALFQSALSFYSMHKASQKVDKDHRWKILPVITQAVLGITHLTRAYGAWHDLQKLQKMVNQVFIMMRHADREKGGDKSKLLETGVARSKEAAKAIQEIQKTYEKQGVRLLASDLIRSQQTANILAQSLGSEQPEIDPNIHEQYDDSKMTHKERKQHPTYAHYKTLNPTEQFNHQPVPGLESGAERYQRMNQALYDFIGGINPNQLGVIVSHQKVLRSLMQGLQLNGHTIPDEFLKNTKNCEMLVLQVQENGMLKGIERKKIELPT
ncbi:MAG: histidine phosphatase family protein [Rhabdochlamydiaceae bacterium]